MVENKNCIDYILFKNVRDAIISKIKYTGSEYGYMLEDFNYFRNRAFISDLVIDKSDKDKEIFEDIKNIYNNMEKRMKEVINYYNLEGRLDSKIIEELMESIYEKLEFEYQKSVAAYAVTGKLKSPEYVKKRKVYKDLLSLSVSALANLSSQEKLEFYLNIPLDFFLSFVNEKI